MVLPFFLFSSVCVNKIVWGLSLTQSTGSTWGVQWWPSTRLTQAHTAIVLREKGVKLSRREGWERWTVSLGTKHKEKVGVKKKGSWEEALKAPRLFMKLATWFPAAFSPFVNNTLQFISPILPHVSNHPITRSSHIFIHPVICVFPSSLVLCK